MRINTKLDGKQKSSEERIKWSGITPQRDFYDYVINRCTSWSLDLKFKDINQYDEWLIKEWEILRVFINSN